MPWIGEKKGKNVFFFFLRHCNIRKQHVCVCVCARVYLNSCTHLHLLHLVSDN